MKVLRRLAAGIQIRSLPVLQTAAFLGVMLAAFSTPSAAASFDCAKASTAVERLICGSPTLSRLDEELARLYALGQQSYASLPNGLAGYRADQRKWLAEERNRCTSADCLGLTMWQRAATLRTSLERAGPSPAAVAETARSALDLDTLLATERSTPASAQVAAGPAVSAASEPDVKNPSVAFSQAVPSPKLPGGQTPRNPQRRDVCETDSATPNHVALCDDPAYSSILTDLWIAQNRAVGELRWEKASKRRALKPQVVAPLQRFMAHPESSCPQMEERCLKEAVRQLDAEMYGIATRLANAARVERDAISEVKSAQRAAEPILVDNGGAASRHSERHGGNYTVLAVRNRTGAGLQEIDVACHLYEDWYDDKPIDPAELRTTIRGNIAPQSSNYFSPPIATPWDLSRYGTDAQVVKCRVLGSVASTVGQAQAAVAQRNADADRVDAARVKMLRAGDQRLAEVQADQVTRLRAVLQASHALGSPHCRSLASTRARELQTVRQYQDMNLKPQAVTLVDGIVSEMRMAGCPGT